MPFPCEIRCGSWVQMAIITLPGCTGGCDWCGDDESRSVDPEIAVEQLWPAGDRVVTLLFDVLLTRKSC